MLPAVADATPDKYEKTPYDSIRHTLQIYYMKPQQRINNKELKAN